MLSTPTIVYGSLPSEIDFPTIAGSPANRDSHKCRLITVTRGPLGRSSSAVNPRPSTKGAPTSLKKLADTRPAGNCSGKVPPVKLMTAVLNAETSSTTCVCC